MLRKSHYFTVLIIFCSNNIYIVNILIFSTENNLINILEIHLFPSKLPLNKGSKKRLKEKTWRLYQMTSN